MGGTITALKTQKRNKERVSVYLDGEFAFGLPLMKAAYLQKGQVLSDEEIDELRAADEKQRAYESALRFLSYRPRSRAEVEERLEEKDVPRAVAEYVVERLQEEGYLDDDEFARFWVQNRESFKPRGLRALQYELRRKGLDDETIERAVSELDEEESAWRAVENRLPRWADLPERELRTRIGGYLARRGFSYDTIGSVFSRAQRFLNLNLNDRTDEN